MHVTLSSMYQRVVSTRLRADPRRDSNPGEGVRAIRARRGAEVPGARRWRARLGLFGTDYLPERRQFDYGLDRDVDFPAATRLRLLIVLPAAISCRYRRSATSS
jgi:hypothetical protein